MIKIQKALSVVPVISTIFIVIYTAINIKRKKDTFKNQCENKELKDFDAVFKKGIGRLCRDGI